MSNERRIGQIYISDLCSHEDKQIVFDFLRFVPHRVEHLFYEKRLRCIGTSPSFDELEKGFDAPEYRVTLTRAGEKTISIECTKVE